MKSEKEHWLYNTRKILLDYGFTENDEEHYTLTTIRQNEGPTVIVNGTKIQQPGQSVKLTYKIEFVGDGYISNEDDTQQINFTNVKFDTIVNDDETSKSTFSECIYWDEVFGDHVQQILKHVLKLKI